VRGGRRGRNEEGKEGVDHLALDVFKNEVQVVVLAIVEADG
jgi:hypothetical protein